MSAWRGSGAGKRIALEVHPAERGARRARALG
jgi:hypothetical protein